MARVEPAIVKATSELREALLGVVSPRLTPPFKPVDLHKAFGVDRRLGWELSRVIQDEDVYSAARHHPGPSGLRRFLKAASAHAAEDQIARAEDAARRFETLVEQVGGDRERFDLLLASLSSRDASEEMLAQRRAAFQANRFIYGAEARMLLRSRVLMPSTERAGMVDIASVAGLVDLCRLRSGCDWPVYVRRWHDVDGKRVGPAVPRAIEPEGAAEGSDAAPLLRSACEPRSLSVELVEVEPGFVEYVLPAGQVGNAGLVTCLLGEVFDGVGSAIGTPGEGGRIDLTTRVSTPVERLVIDTMVHESLTSIGEPEVLLRNEIQRMFRGRQAWTPADTLEPLGEVRRLGAGLGRLGMVDALWYAPAIAKVLERLGLDADEYIAYRVSLPYPPIGSTATVAFPLADPDDES